MDLHHVFGGGVADGDVGHNAVLVVGGAHGVDPVLTLAQAQVLRHQLLVEGRAVGSLGGEGYALGQGDLLAGVVVEVLDGEVVLIGGVIHVDDDGLGAGDGAGQAVGVDAGVHLVGVVKGCHISGHIVGVILAVGLDLHVQRLEQVVIAALVLGAVGQQVVDVHIGGILGAVGIGNGDGLHLIAVDDGAAALVKGHAVGGLGIDRPAQQLEVLGDLVRAQGSGGTLGLHVVLVGAGLHGHAALLAHVVDHHGVVGALPLGGVDRAAGDGLRHLRQPAGKLPGGLAGGLALEGRSIVTVVEAVVVLLGEGAVLAGQIGHGVVDVGEGAVDLHVLGGHGFKNGSPAAEAHAHGGCGGVAHGDGVAIVVALHLAVLLAVHEVGDGIGHLLGGQLNGHVLAQVGQLHLAEGVVHAVDRDGGQLIAGVQGPVDGDIAAGRIGTGAAGGLDALVAGDGDDILMAVIDQGQGLAGAAVQLDGLGALVGIEDVGLVVVDRLVLDVVGGDHAAVGAAGRHVQIAVLGNLRLIAGEGAVDMLDGVTHVAEGLPLIAEGEGDIVAIGQFAGGLGGLTHQGIAALIGVGGGVTGHTQGHILGILDDDGLVGQVLPAVVGGVQLIHHGELGHLFPLGHIGRAALGDGLAHLGAPAVEHPAGLAGGSAGKGGRLVAGVEAGGGLGLKGAVVAGLVGHFIGGQRLVGADDGHAALGQDAGVISAGVGSVIAHELVAHAVEGNFSNALSRAQVIALAHQAGDRISITDGIAVFILEQDGSGYLVVGIIDQCDGHIIRAEGAAGSAGGCCVKGISGGGGGHGDLIAFADVVGLIHGVVLKALVLAAVGEFIDHIEFVVDALGGDLHTVGVRQVGKGKALRLASEALAVLEDGIHFVARLDTPADGHISTGVIGVGGSDEGAAVVNIGGDGIAVADVGDGDGLLVVLVQGHVVGSVGLSIGVLAIDGHGGQAAGGNYLSVLALEVLGDGGLGIGGSLAVGADVVLVHHLVLGGVGYAALIPQGDDGAQAVGFRLGLAVVQSVGGVVVSLLLSRLIVLIVAVGQGLDRDRLGVVLLIAFVVGVGVEIGHHGVVGQGLPGAGEGHVAGDGELAVSHGGVIGGPAVELVAVEGRGGRHVNHSALGTGLGGGRGGRALGHLAGVLVGHGVGVLELIVPHQGALAGGGGNIGRVVRVVLIVQLAAHMEPGLVGPIGNALGGQVYVKDGLAPVGDGGDGPVGGQDGDGLVGIDVPVLHGHGADRIAGLGQGEVGVDGLALAAAGDLVLKLGVAVQGVAGMYAGGLGAVLELDLIGQGDDIAAIAQLALAGIPGDEVAGLLQNAVGNAGDRGAAGHHGEIGPHGVPDHGGDVGGDVLHGLVQLGIVAGQQGVAGIGGQAVERVAGEGEAHGVDDAAVVLEAVGGSVGIAVIGSAVGHHHHHLAGGAALELVHAQIHADGQVGAALGRQPIQLALRDNLGAALLSNAVVISAGREDDKPGGELAAQLLSQGAHHVLDGGDRGCQAGGGAVAHVGAGLAAVIVIMVVRLLAAGVAAALAVLMLSLAAGQVVVRTPAFFAVRTTDMLPTCAYSKESVIPHPVVRMVVPGALLVAPATEAAVGVLLHAAVIAAGGGVSVLLRAPGHGSRDVQNEHNLQGLLLDLNLVDLGRQSDLPLVGGGALGVLGQNHLGVALAGLIAVYIVVLAAGVQGVLPRGQHAHGQQAHDHGRGEQGCQKSLGFLCQHFHSPFGENGSAAAGRAWRGGPRFSLLALRPGFSAGLPLSVP